jgi:lipopolysaccharide biosynthesis regulator YciM
MKTDTSIYSGNPDVAVYNIGADSKVAKTCHELHESQRAAINKTEDGSEERTELIEKMKLSGLKFNNLTDSIEEIYNLFRTFPQSGKRLAEAEHCFLNSDLEGMDAALPEKEILAEIALLKQQSEAQSDADRKQTNLALREHSYELLLKGFLHRTHVEDPEWYVNVWNALTQALEASYNSHTLLCYGWYCVLNNDLAKAREFYTAASSDRWMEKELTEENKLFIRATCLRRLATISSREDDPPAAIRTLQQALTLITELRDRNPEAYLPAVAEVLTILSEYHMRNEAYSVAIEECEEAVRIRRKLTLQHNDIYFPNLIRPLENLAFLYAAKKEFRTSAACYEEVISITRKCLLLDLDDFMPKLATLLTNLAVIYEYLAEDEKILPLLKEAVKLLRQVVVIDPETYQPNLAHALCQLASRSRLQGELQEAYRSMEEGLTLYRQSVLRSPSENLQPLSEWLKELSEWYWEDDKAEENFRISHERVDVCRRLVRLCPLDFLPYLGQAYGSLATLYFEKGDYEDCLSTKIKGLETARKLVKLEKGYTHVLGIQQARLAEFYLETMPDKEKSLAAAAEACKLLKPLYKKHELCNEGYLLAQKVIRSWAEQEASD